MEDFREDFREFATLNVGDADFYINSAFKRARENSEKVFVKEKTAKKILEKKKRHKKTRLRRDYELELTKKLETLHIETIENALCKSFEKISTSFPNLERLTRFYKELIDCTIGIGEAKKALASINWCRKKLSQLSRVYRRKIRSSKEIFAVKHYRRAFDGRCASVVKRIDKHLRFLREASKTMKEYPLLKDMFTVAIAGFPNVGKSTLLSKITDARPEIAAYPFTTKSIMLGYTNSQIFRGADKDIQVIDTPGTLSREDKMNAMERQAYLAMKYAANTIIYVFDPDESSSLEKQEQLFEIINRMGKHLITYISKTDLKTEKIIRNAQLIEKKYNAIKDSEELKEIITREAQGFYREKMHKKSEY